MRPEAGRQIVNRAATVPAKSHLSQLKAAVERALANNPQFRQNFIRTAQAARDGFATAPANQRGLAAEYNFLLKILK